MSSDMDMTTNSNHGSHLYRRLDFDVEDNNFRSSNEVDEVDMYQDENEIDDHLDAHSTESVEEVHERIPKELIPIVGMEFESEKSAHMFYLSYAKAVGFGVRMWKAHKDKETGTIWDRVFCCARQGERKNDVRVDGKVHRPLTRCNCGAQMKISCRQTSKYRIVRFVAEHNHECVTPSKTHLIRSHRKMTVAQKSEIDMATSCGIAQRETMELMARQVGGRENLGFISVDCKNYVRSKRTVKMRVGDTGGVLQYLQKKQAEDPNFFYAIQVDEDELMTNIFWADAKMRSDYSYFGDVVCFDTTYRKHKDGRPIALFVGVNNHKQTIVFGAALLYDETADTFTWLFDTFVKAMLGKKPQTILTDQDKAMSKALSSQWKETYHRLCVWHINQNAATHLSHVFAKYKDFAKDFSSCMYDHDNEDEFINAWHVMIDKYSLQDNTWLEGLYKIQKKWALVYGRETFCADMTTTQRSESMNNVIKKYISYKYELVEFFEHFERLLMDRRYKELDADYKINQSDHPLSFSVQIVKHASNIYTKKIFELFQREACYAHDCIVETRCENDTMTEFNVFYSKKSYGHRVTYDSIDGSVSCSCRKFLFVGILCSHALKVLNVKHVMKIPDQYIMKRWTKSAKKQVAQVKFHNMSQVDPKEAPSYRYRNLCQLNSQLNARAAESAKAYDIAKQGLMKLLEEVNASFEQGENQESTPTSENVCVPDLVGSIIRDSISTKTVRGIKIKEKTTYKSSKRPKSGLEKATRKRKPSKLTSSQSIEDSQRYLEGSQYSIANMKHNESMGTTFMMQPPFGMSTSRTNNCNLSISMNRHESEGRLTELLKMMDSNVNEHQVGARDPSYEQVYRPEPHLGLGAISRMGQPSYINQDD